MANTLELGNGKWATGKDTVLAYNDLNNNFKPLPFSFSRASNATVVNKAGLIETVGSGEPRIDFLGNTKGALKLEPQRTNKITYSEDFSQSAWVKLGAGTGSAAIVTSGYAISPDGSQNASRLQCNLGNGNTVSDQSLIYDSYNLSGSQTISIYAKSNNNQNQTLYFSNTVTYDETDNIVVTNEWKRFEFTHSTTTDVLAIGLRGGTGSDNVVDVLVWAAQAEQGSYATSYIPTQGSAVTRVADFCNNGGNEQVINSTEGVLYFEGSVIADVGETYKLSLNDGTNNNRIGIDFSVVSERVTFLHKGQGSATLVGTVNGIDKTAINKMALSYNSTTFKTYLNGIEVVNLSINNTILGLNELIFENTVGNDIFYGNVKDIRVYNTALTDNELKQLTTI